MSEKIIKYPYRDVIRIANRLVELLRPHCERIEIAGSLRRKKQEVGDIEIIVIPKPYLVGLFESGIATVINKFKKVKGNLEYGKCKYTQRILPEGIKLDLFIADEDNWGYIYAMRTGSANFSHNILANAWTQAGFKGVKGYMTKNSKIYPAKEEKDFFRMIGVSYVEPERRNL